MTIGNGKKMVDMLIFQLHLPHVIINSTQALCALSHLQITFQKAQFHISMYLAYVNTKI